MQIQINANSNIDGRERLTTYVTGVVEDALSRFRERLARVELHLSEEEGHRGGQDDKRCMIEARLKGRHPIVVTHEASSMNDAVGGALSKLKRSIESAIERLQDCR